MPLLETFATLAGKRSAVQLLLVGSGPLQGNVERFVAERKLNGKVHLAGRRNDVPGLMRAADCLVLPSLWEGMPNVVLEAMAAGLPVVATGVEGTEELIENNKTGLVVPANDAAAFLTAVESVIDDSISAEERAKQAQEHMGKHFTWEKIAALYVELYDEVLSEIA